MLGTVNTGINVFLLQIFGDRYYHYCFTDEAIDSRMVGLGDCIMKRISLQKRN